jgi:hypothetical protein
LLSEKKLFICHHDAAKGSAVLYWVIDTRKLHASFPLSGQKFFAKNRHLKEFQNPRLLAGIG